MELVRGDLAVTALVIGAMSLAIAAGVATRHASTARGGRVRGLAPLVPWLGGLLVLVLLVRGAIAGAAVVAVATVLHAAITRFRTVLGRR